MVFNTKEERRRKDDPAKIQKRMDKVRGHLFYLKVFKNLIFLFGSSSQQNLHHHDDDRRSMVVETPALGGPLVSRREDTSC